MFLLLMDFQKMMKYFSTKLKNILSSGCNLAACSDLFSFLDSSLRDSDLKDTFTSPSTIAESLSHLKLGKSEGTKFNLLSNHFIYASSVLSGFLSNLFTAMLRHGYVLDYRDYVYGIGNALISRNTPLNTGHNSLVYRGHEGA